MITQRTVRPDGMLCEAKLSEGYAYRYILTRVWAQTTPYITWIMLNPSTADGDKDDNTVTRCVTFAREWGASGIRVLNLFAYRTSYPAQLRAHGWGVVGPDNDKILACMARSGHQAGGLVIAAWGNHGVLNGRDQEVMALMAEQQVPLWCLGQTMEGRPKHPLRLAHDVKPEVFRG